MNELVVIRDETPRYQWRIGRITRLIKGRDGVVRTAEVEMLLREGRQERKLTRAIQHLVPVERNLAGEDVAPEEPATRATVPSSVKGTRAANEN